jgi:hypothetical protein
LRCISVPERLRVQRGKYDLFKVCHIGHPGLGCNL